MNSVIKLGDLVRIHKFDIDAVLVDDCYVNNGIKGLIFKTFLEDPEKAYCVLYDYQLLRAKIEVITEKAYSVKRGDLPFFYDIELIK